MAMKISRSWDPDRTSLKHWHSIVLDSNTARSLIDQELKRFAINLPRVARKLEADLKKKRIESEVFDVICNTIKKRSARILGYFKN